MDPHLRLMVIADQLAMLSRSVSESWVRLEPVPGRPDKMVRTLKPEFQERYDRIIGEIARLERERLEIKRELEIKKERPG